MSDFECAPLRAIEQVFPAASKSGCMFHMGQSLFRKWRRAGMEAFYADPLVGELSRKTFRNILALALIPIEEVRHAFQLVVQHAPNGLQAFLAYFAQNYIGLTRRQQEEGANASFLRIMCNHHKIYRQNSVFLVYLFLCFYLTNSIKILLCVFDSS
uniref:Uncharacterized protein n=1 Tax=Meloidogyne enterolobii TaxID=390850 RepID=A0A6V7WTK4_MELEN|nr:unnamed protein product [Meloidogyne enterolobii]